MKNIIQDSSKWEQYKKMHKLTFKTEEPKKKREKRDKKAEEELRQIQMELKNKMNISQTKEYRKKYYELHKDKWNRASKEERDKEREYNPTNIELEGIVVSDDIMETIRQKYVQSVKQKCVFDTYNILQAAQVLCLKCKGCDIKQEDTYGIKWRLNEEDDTKIEQVLWCRKTDCPVWSFRILNSNEIYSNGDLKRYNSKKDGRDLRWNK